MEEPVEFPYRAEYAKSGRASCRQCSGSIEKGILRLAVMIQSASFDGKITHWYHFKCFFIKQRPKSVEDIAHFDSLRWEDQQKIKDKIENAGPAPVNGKQKKGQKYSSDFSVEYAKSGRAECKECLEKIPKDVIRVSKMDYESEKAKRFGPMPRWHHVNCFAKIRDELEFFDGAPDLPGFNTLCADDKTALRSKLPKLEKKRKAEDEPDSVAKKAKKDADSATKKQSKKMFAFRDSLEKNLKKSELAELLNYNGYCSFSGEMRMLDVLADLMTFGVIENCKLCKSGNYTYVFGVGYVCNGDISEWTKCRNVIEEPTRTPFRIPEEFKEAFEFLGQYKFKENGHRVVNKRSVQPSNGSADRVKKEKPVPLAGLSFAILGLASDKKKSVADKIARLGGEIAAKAGQSTAAIVTVPDQVKTDNSKMKAAVKYGIHCVTEDFLDEIEPEMEGSAVLMIKKKNLAAWAKDLEQRIEKSKKTKSKSSSKSTSGSKSSMYEKIPTKMKVTLKEGNQVDPVSGLANSCHVYQRGEKTYSVVLGLVDLVRGTNSYYKIQILESDQRSEWYVFTAWGRIGTTIGSHKVQECDDPKDALVAFSEVYESKTGNKFTAREQTKLPGYWFPLEMDHGHKKEKQVASLNVAESKSKLPAAVKELVALIFDVKMMEKTMVEYELDLKKMPLGKLSQRQLQKALSVLSEALELIEEDTEEKKEPGALSRLLLDCSNRFYTLLPHDFGMNNPPILNNVQFIKTKIEMIESLMEIEIAYNLLASEETSEKDPLDESYQKLKTEISVLDRQNDLFKTIESYVANTHASTHSHYTLAVDEVFQIKRENEEKRFKPFKKLPNRQLLWHGSRLTNFAGILSQGLRIAPPEAPSTGYMFGKGIYFADMVSKSANYCNASKTKPTGLLLLCDVALGNMYELKHAKDIRKLPGGKHSVKGLGKTRPDPSQTVTLDKGLTVPLGPPVPSDVAQCDLLYNEYIVYDVAQVNIKYLVKTTFNYKY